MRWEIRPQALCISMAPGRGDILKVEILKIELRSWGVMCSSFAYGAFAGRFPDPKAVIFEIIDNKIRFDEKLTLDCCPMIGVIGTAPRRGGNRHGDAWRSWRKHGLP